jgi:hypothetical protein
MAEPSAEQLEIAHRLLALEGAAGGSNQHAAAAANVYKKLRSHLGPLVGLAAVRGLLVRSAMLTKVQFPFIGDVSVENDEAAVNALRASLGGQQPVAATQAAAFLFGAFLTLLSTYIGERLTTQALQSAWPNIDEPAAKGRKR